MAYYNIFRIALAITLTFGSNKIWSQHKLPTFLEGTWKVENKETYEHWDVMSNNSMKGFGYTLNDNKIKVTEYLGIRKEGTNIIYNAQVIGQNDGKSIDFKMTKQDSAKYIFENTRHDFPQTIIYRKLNDSTVEVSLSSSFYKQMYLYKIFKQPLSQPSTDSNIKNPNYDPVLAQKYEADEYGMKSYYFVILKTGSKQSGDNSHVTKVFKGHLDNIQKLVDNKKMIVAGPFSKNEKNYRGLFILDNLNNLQEAKTILDTDPAIKEGYLDYDIFRWHGSAALPAYLPVSDKIWKSKP